MFDELNTGKTSPTGVSSKPVEDIFSETDNVKDNPAAKPAVFQPKAPTPAPVRGSGREDKVPGGGRKFFFLGLAILMLALLAYGGYWAFAKYGQSLILGSKKVDNIQKQTTTNGAVQKNSNEVSNTRENAPVTSTALVITENPASTPLESSPATQPQTQAETLTASSTLTDSDQDGLTDYEEINIYHTNPNNPDTDGDGLFDREEVKVYHTNPLVKDTDGDGYSDGDEVKNGYNPNGPGKLYDINKK